MKKIDILISKALERSKTGLAFDHRPDSVYSVNISLRRGLVPIQNAGWRKDIVEIRAAASAV